MTTSLYRAYLVGFFLFCSIEWCHPRSTMCIYLLCKTKRLSFDELKVHVNQCHKMAGDTTYYVGREGGRLLRWIKKKSDYNIRDRSFSSFMWGSTTNFNHVFIIGMTFSKYHGLFFFFHGHSYWRHRTDTIISSHIVRYVKRTHTVQKRETAS